MDAASIETARAASENTIAQLQALSEAMQGDVTQKTGLRSKGRFRRRRTA